MQIVCVLRSGGDYGVEHVEKLFWCCRKHVLGDFNFWCYTDLYPSDFMDPVFFHRGFHWVGLEDNWPGWWSKFELFRKNPWLTGPRLYLDLDTVVTGRLDDLFCYFNKDLVTFDAMKKRACSRNELCSGVMWWEKDLSVIYDAVKPIVEARMQSPDTLFQYPLEQEILRDLVKEHGFSLDNFSNQTPGKVLSYKYDKVGDTVPEDARIIAFHGKPRPWDVKHDWIDAAWA